jgi:chromosome partitioning protein
MLVTSITNQKGGVGKTTSAVSISSEFAARGKSVLLLDIDPQASASSGLRVDLKASGDDLYDVFFSSRTLGSIIQKTSFDNLEIVPASRDLVSLEAEIGRKPGRELILKSELRNLERKYDYVFIDCPPSSGLLSLNALGASQSIIVPLQAEYYALEGVSSLMNTIKFVKETFNPQVKLLGVFLTMFDARTNLSLQVLQEAKDFFGSTLFTSFIPRNIKLSECPSHGMPINIYDPLSAGAKAYKNLCDELLNRFLIAFTSPDEDPSRKSISRVRGIKAASNF